MARPSALRQRKNRKLQRSKAPTSLARTPRPPVTSVTPTSVGSLERDLAERRRTQPDIEAQVDMVAGDPVGGGSTPTESAADATYFGRHIPVTPPGTRQIDQREDETSPEYYDRLRKAGGLNRAEWLAKLEKDRADRAAGRVTIDVDGVPTKVTPEVAARNEELDRLYRPRLARTTAGYDMAMGTERRMGMLREQEEGRAVPWKEFENAAERQAFEAGGGKIDYSGTLQPSGTGFYRTEGGGTFVARGTDLDIRQTSLRRPAVGQPGGETEAEFAQRKKEILEARRDPNRTYQDVVRERLQRTRKVEEGAIEHTRAMELSRLQPGGERTTELAGLTAEAVAQKGAEANKTIAQIEADVKLKGQQLNLTTAQMQAEIAERIALSQQRNAVTLLEMDIKGKTIHQQILADSGVDIEELKGKTSVQLAQMASDMNIDLAEINLKIEKWKDDTKRAGFESQERIHDLHNKAQVEIAGLGLDKAELAEKKELAKTVTGLIKQRSVALQAGQMDLVEMIDALIAKADPEFATQSDDLRRRSLVSGLKAAIGTAEPWLGFNVGEEFYPKLTAMISSLELVESTLGKRAGEAAYYAALAENDLKHLEGQYERLQAWGKGDPAALDRLGTLLETVRTKFAVAKAAGEADTPPTDTPPTGGPPTGGPPTPETVKAEDTEVMVGGVLYIKNPSDGKFYPPKKNPNEVLGPPSPAR